MKICTRCKEPKTLDSFWKTKSSKDGLYAYCRLCAKIKFSKYSEENKEERAAYKNKWNADNKKHNAKIHKAWADDNRDRVNKNRKKVRDRYPEREKARQAVRDSLRTGQLTKKPCERCNTTKKVQAHHESYEKSHWLIVNWLCKEHHDERHMEMNGIS